MGNLLRLRSEEGFVTTARQLGDNIFLLIEEQNSITPRIYEVYMDNQEFIKLVTWIRNYQGKNRPIKEILQEIA